MLRKRVFFLAVKRGAAGRRLVEAQSDLNLVVDSFRLNPLNLLGHPADDSKPDATEGAAKLESEGSDPLSRWLKARQGPLDLERLKCLGNVVMPACARMALHIIAHDMRNER